MNHDTRAFRRRTVLGERERTKRKFRTRVRYLVPKEKKKKRKARSVTCREINERHVGVRGAKQEWTSNVNRTRSTNCKRLIG